jgi:dienelactone hydrolase
MIKRSIIFSILLSFLYSNEGETITFTSANPFGFNDVLSALDQQEPQEVYGVLKMPDQMGNKKVPLVIGVAGSLGWMDHHYEYLQMYQEMGIATFEVKSFASRGIQSTVGSQVEVTMAAMMLDVYRAFEIDRDKVAITGWSLGGGVTLFSGWLPAKNAMNPDLKFAAHLAIYPPCFIVPENLEFTDAPMHILIGEVDNWTPAAACKDLIPDMIGNGTNIGITVYEDSHHSFDSSTPPRVDEAGYSFTDCRLKMRTDGVVVMNFMDIPMTNPTLQKIGLAFCADRGPTHGGNPESRKAAFVFAKDFMGKHLLDND